MDPKVSVSIRAYNHEAYIKQAILSVSKQTYRNLEIIVVNDASTDGTHEIIQELADNDPRIIYIHNQPNQGRVASDNIIVEAATGEYMARLDGDDYWIDPEKIELQVQFLQENPDHILVGNFVKNVNENGSHRDYQYYLTSDEEIREDILATNHIAASGVLFRTYAIKKIGGYSDQYHYIDDLEVWLQMGAMGKFANLPYVWTAHRMTGVNAGEQNRKDQLKEVLDVIKKHRHEYPHYAKAVIKIQIQLMVFSLPSPLLNTLRMIKRFVNRFRSSTVLTHE